MTEVLERPIEDTTPADTDDSVTHVVCGVSNEDERTVPMYAICGVDITFESINLQEDAPLCKKCEELCPQHLKLCRGVKPCKIPRPL